MDCLVEYDYVAVQNDELTINKGDIIRNVVPFEDGWKKGWLNGKEGVFPDNFVRVIRVSNKENSQNSCKSDLMSKFKEQLTMNNSQNDLLIHRDNHNINDNIANSLINYKIKNIQEINTNNHPNLQLDSCDLMKTSLPKYDSTYSVPMLNCKNEVNKPSDSSQDTVIALFEYKPENADELKLEVGEVLQVIDKHLIDDGWWKGIKKSGEVGIFPCNFVEAISDSFTKKSLIIENNLCKPDSSREISNLSASGSINDISMGQRTQPQLSPNKSQGTTVNSFNKSTKTKIINTNSMSMDTINDKAKYHENTVKSTNNINKKETSKAEDNSNSYEKSKMKSIPLESFNNDDYRPNYFDIYMTKKEFQKYKQDFENKLSKLTIRIQTLIEEIDEEKKQRAASEIELVRLRRVVHMLDAQNMNGLI